MAGILAKVGAHPFGGEVNVKRFIAGLAALFVLVGAAAAQTPKVGHVFIVLEENKNYSEVMEGPSMPYLKSLALKYGLATQYYANTHPSIGNYFMLTTGQIITNNDHYKGIVDADNIVRHFAAQGITWKSYAEDLPEVGYVGGSTGKYMKRHNPFAYLSDVVKNEKERRNIVPFSQFAADLQTGSFPQYSFIVPNGCNDSHDCPSSVADKWLEQNIAPLLESPLFQKDGLLIITYDEAEASDKTHGGGRIATVLIGPMVKKSFKSAQFYQHQSLLRLTMQVLGLNSFPGAAATAPSMDEFFQTSGNAEASKPK